MFTSAAVRGGVMLAALMVAACSSGRAQEGTPNAAKQEMAAQAETQAAKAAAPETQATKADIAAYYLTKYAEQIVWHAKGLIPFCDRDAEWTHLTPEQMPDYYLRTMQEYAEQVTEPKDGDGFLTLAVDYAGLVGERVARARQAGKGELGVDIEEFRRYRQILVTLAARREAMGKAWEKDIVPTLEICYAYFAMMAWLTDKPEIRAMFESLKPEKGSPLMKGWREGATRAGYLTPVGLEFSIDAGKGADLEHMALSPDGKRVAVAADGKKQIQVWDLEARVMVKAWNEADEVEHLAWARD